MSAEKHIHNWNAADELVFVSGANKGSHVDVFCICTHCNMGAFTDEQGNVIPTSIAEVGFRE